MNTVKYLVVQGANVNIRDNTGVRVLLIVKYYCGFEFELASFIHRHLHVTKDPSCIKYSLEYSSLISGNLIGE